MPLNILLIDDSPTFLRSLRQFLVSLPDTYVLGECHDGYDALTQVTQLRPHVVLMDIAMPLVNGFDAARQLRGMAHAPQVVFLSLTDSVVYRDKAHKLGAAGFVCKADLLADLPPLLTRLVAQGFASRRDRLTWFDGHRPI